MAKKAQPAPEPPAAPAEPPPALPPQATGWEYRSTWHPRGDFDAAATLLGSQGWELFAVLPETERSPELTGGWRAFWKRRAA